MSYHINELYTDISGKIQFIEISLDPVNGETFRIDQTIRVTQDGSTTAIRLLKDLPNPNTAGATILVATQSFANLGIVTPDFIISDDFLFNCGSATVSLINSDHSTSDAMTYFSLPIDGMNAINHDGVFGINSPKNLAGATGTVPGNETVGATDGADNLVGTAGDDIIMAKAGNDILNGLAGNDKLDGGAGADTVIFSGNSSDYVISAHGSCFNVSGPDGNDDLYNIERGHFLDKNLAADLAQGQAAGNTVRLIGAAFDANNIIPEYVAIGLQLFDSGQSMLQASQMVVNTPLFISLAGSSSNVDFVNFVYQNVVGEQPSSAVRDSYVEMLQGSGGTMTQAELLILAANSSVNEANINLVGLYQSGVEYSG
ncbi:DUF4214 domain-containing protein [Nitrosomonas sp. Nm132]|uniref:DUF4214 domain-containing protein n=1 Tax=Nitrosomonas sp. Nm132 TaxID=1881053 RepID=UPI000882B24B|nr:DUF4214 domain-containing protein [Nitrosomonas sp. Nm132]SDH53298.1 protein of unknown function [Nitrosomonas sp. Nm132]